MENWQKMINDRLRPAIVAMTREIKQQNPGHGIGLNYTIRYPRRFIAGQDTNIPITIPSEHGPFHIADAVVSVGEDRKIMDVGIHMYDTPRVYDPAEEDTVNYQPSTTDGLRKINVFLSDFNEVLFGDAVRSLMNPKYSVMDFPKPGVIPISGKPLGSYRIPDSQGSVRNWNSIKANHLNAEAARASKIKSKTGREEFVQEALDNPTRAPHWYWALGGKQKEDATGKIVELYLESCKSSEKTIPPTMFFEKLRSSMVLRQQLLPYCERDSQRVEGSANNECMNQSCSEYRANCPRFSYRLNTQN